MDPLTVGSLALSVGELVGGYAFGKVIDATLERILRKRAETARDILFQELAQGALLPIEAAQQEDFVASVYRFHRSATEGAARLNLRLLASILAGQQEQGTLSADKFLYYADVLASLRREEIKVLGELFKRTRELRDSGRYEITESKDTREIKKEAFRLTAKKYSDDHALHFHATMTALTRTGLIASFGMTHTGGVATYFFCTPLMDEVWQEAKFDKVLSREGIIL